ncbi:MAG: Fic family protein [Muribaculaceae bacterium]|nr:Fic family protein [Muribaculaceae bacterium]
MIEQPPLQTQPQEGVSRPAAPAIAERIAQINNGYLYWSDVKYRTQDTGLTPEELWALVKESRRARDTAVWPEFNLHFALTDTMQRLCHEFDLNFGGSWGAMRLFPQDRTNQELYLISSIMEEAISSSQMEGASTTREVAKEMLRKRQEPRDRSQRMILNNYQTIQFLSEHRHSPLTPELFLQVHELMTAGTLADDAYAGKLRDHDRIVVGNSITGEVIHRPPAHESLGRFVEYLCAFFNDNNNQPFIHPIIKGIIIHFLVAYYHPFVDGNGRTARALFYWYMLKHNYWLMEYLSISRIIYRSKSRYEKSFLYTESDGNDLGYFIHYNLDVLSKAFDGLKKYLLKKQSERKRTDRFMHLDGLSHSQAEIVRMFYDEGDIALEAKDVAARFNVSRVTAKGYLEELVRRGLLTRISPNGRTHAFVRSDGFDSVLDNLLTNKSD